MGLVVQKFGGSSVGNRDRIQAVARRVAARRASGDQVVAVVSAMGDTTDHLLALAGELCARPDRSHPRELDMLLTAGERIAMALTAMAIREAGAEAISFTGSQAAIITDDSHTGARIEEIRADRLREELERGRVVIVAGFQGVSRGGEVTTLGRGGSDTTAVALAAALSADLCEIYTDVSGVHTADPLRVPDARIIPRIGYREMLELATSGARVMHPRAVEIGARFGVHIRVISSLDEGTTGVSGTSIGEQDTRIEPLALTGIASESGFVRFILRGMPAGMAATTEVLSRFAAAGISVDMVSQADDASGGQRQLQLTVRDSAFDEARELFEALVADLGADSLETRTGLARVVLVGSGMHDRPGVYADALRTLLKAEIDVHGLTTSSVSIALLIDGQHEDLALRELHSAFGLDSVEVRA